MPTTPSIMAFPHDHQMNPYTIVSMMIVMSNKTTFVLIVFMIMTMSNSTQQPLEMTRLIR